MRQTAFCCGFRALAIVLILVLLYGCAATPGRDQPIGYVVSSTFSADGKLLAAATSEGEVALFDVHPLKFRRLLTHESDKKVLPRQYAAMIEAVYRPLALAFSPDGRLLAAAGIGGKIVVWDVASGLRQHEMTVSAQAADLVFTPDSGALCIAGPGLTIWHLNDTSPAASLPLPKEAKATSAAMSPDGSVLAVGLSSGEIAMFETDAWKLLRVSKEHEAPVTGLAFQKQGSTFASTAGGYDLRIWERATGGGFAKSAQTPNAVSSAAETFGTAQVAGALLWLIGTVRGFQIAGGPTLGGPPILGGTESAFSKSGRVIPFHCGSRVAFSEDGRHLISTANLMKCSDCIGTLAPAFMLFMTDLETGKTETVRDLGCEIAVSPDSKTVAVGGPGAPQIRNIVTGQKIPLD